MWGLRSCGPKVLGNYIAVEDRATQRCDPSATARLRQDRGGLKEQAPLSEYTRKGDRKMAMKNPVYYRMMLDGRFVGFKRIVTEYLPASHTTWQLASLKHNPDETSQLSTPAFGIETYKREKIVSSKKRE